MYIQCDFLGPFKVWRPKTLEASKNLDSKNYYAQSCWLLLITCSYTRFTSFELTYSTDTSHVLQSLMHHCYRYGFPKAIYADQQTSFIKLQPSINKLLNTIDWAFIQKAVSIHGIDILFEEDNLSRGFISTSTPRSQYKNGAAESLVHVFKVRLAAELQEYTMVEAEFRLVVGHISHIMNSRPLGQFQRAETNESMIISPYLMVYARLSQMQHMLPENLWTIQHPKLYQIAQQRISLYHKLIRNYLTSYFDRVINPIEGSGKHRSMHASVPRVDTFYWYRVSDNRMQKSNDPRKWSICKVKELIRSQRDKLVHSVKAHSFSSKKEVLIDINNLRYLETMQDPDLQFKDQVDHITDVSTRYDLRKRIAKPRPPQRK